MNSRGACWDLFGCQDKSNSLLFIIRIINTVYIVNKDRKSWLSFRLVLRLLTSPPTPTPTLYSMQFVDCDLQKQKKTQSIL